MSENKKRRIFRMIKVCERVKKSEEGRATSSKRLTLYVKFTVAS